SASLPAPCAGLPTYPAPCAGLPTPHTTDRRSKHEARWHFPPAGPSTNLLCAGLLTPHHLMCAGPPLVVRGSPDPAPDSLCAGLPLLCAGLPTPHPDASG